MYEGEGGDVCMGSRLTCSPYTWNHVALVIEPVAEEAGECGKSDCRIFINGKRVFNFFMPHCLSSVQYPLLPHPQTNPIIGMDTMEHRPFIGRMSAFIVCLYCLVYSQISERAFSDPQVADLSDMHDQLSVPMQALCNGLYFSPSSIPNHDGSLLQLVQSQAQSAGSQSQSAEAQSAEAQSAGSQALPGTPTPSLSLAERLMEAYLRRPDRYAPPQGNLRGSNSLPPPPAEKDELCRTTPPEPLPEPTGALKDFVEGLHQSRTSQHEALTKGEASFTVPPEVAEDYHNLNEYRAQSVRQAFCYAWEWYKERAWGSDEIRPVSGVRSDRWANTAMNVMDSVDTMVLLGLHKEEEEARKVAQNVHFDSSQPISMFETTIRVLGGTLAAYQYTNQSVYLTKANDVGNRMMPAFNTPSGYPLVSNAR